MSKMATICAFASGQGAPTLRRSATARSTCMAASATRRSSVSRTNLITPRGQRSQLPGSSLGHRHIHHTPYSLQSPHTAFSLLTTRALLDDEPLEDEELAFDSPVDELLSHRSFQMTTEEDWEDCIGEEGLDEGDEDEFWETSNTTWFFELTSESEGLTWHQYILRDQGHTPDSYQLGKKLAMWDGREHFVSLKRVVHLRDQFQYLSVGYDKEKGTAEALQGDVPKEVYVEGLLKDIEALSTLMQFQAAYPVKFFGSERGSDLLPCMFQLPPDTELSATAMWNLLGISPELVAQFPKPILFKTGDDFVNFVQKQIPQWRAGWRQWLDARMEQEALSDELYSFLKSGPQFAEIDRRAQEFAAYVRGPIVQIVAGSEDISMDPVPFFWVGVSPHDSERVLGMMGAVYKNDTDALY